MLLSMAPRADAQNWPPVTRAECRKVIVDAFNRAMGTLARGDDPAWNWSDPSFAELNGCLQYGPWSPPALESSRWVLLTMRGDAHDTIYMEPPTGPVKTPTMLSSWLFARARLAHDSIAARGLFFLGIKTDTRPTRLDRPDALWLWALLRDPSTDLAAKLDTLREALPEERLTFESVSRIRAKH